MTDKVFPRGTKIDAVFDFIDLVQYDALVMAYLEYLGYPDYVREFRPEDLAKRIADTQRACKDVGISARMCALIVFGMTWTYGILPLAENDVRHQTKH